MPSTPAIGYLAANDPSTHVATAVPPPNDAQPPLPDVETSLLASGDMGAEIAALCVKTGGAERKTAREERDHWLATEKSEDDAEVAKMHDKADSYRTQGWVDGVATVVSAGAGCASTSGDKQGAGEQQTTEQSAAQASGNGGTSGSGYRAGASIGGALVAGGAKVADGYFRGSQADDDADIKAHESASKQAAGAAEDAHDDAKDASELVKAALDFYREYTGTQAQARNAALHKA